MILITGYGYTFLSCVLRPVVGCLIEHVGLKQVRQTLLFCAAVFFFVLAKITMILIRFVEKTCSERVNIHSPTWEDGIGLI